MTPKSIKLLALAVICGCSLIGFGLNARGGLEALLLFSVFIVTALWFIFYWFWIEDKRNWPK